LRGRHALKDAAHAVESGWIANCFGSSVWYFHHLPRLCRLQIVIEMYGRKIDRNSQANEFWGRSCETADSKSERLMMDLSMTLLFLWTAATCFFSIGRFEGLETVITCVLFAEASSGISGLLLTESVKSHGNRTRVRKLLGNLLYLVIITSKSIDEQIETRDDKI
jgi:hypothetical protein